MTWFENSEGEFKSIAHFALFMVLWFSPMVIFALVMWWVGADMWWAY